MRPTTPDRLERYDSLPEDSPYADTGCPDLGIPACLDCPLPVCRYEVKGGGWYLLNIVRDLQMRRDRREGVPVDEIADRYGVNRRTVYRVTESPFAQRERTPKLSEEEADAHAIAEHRRLAIGDRI